MNDDQFIKLMKYLDTRFDEVNDRIEKLEMSIKSRFDQLTSIIDACVGKRETCAMAAMLI